MNKEGFIMNDMKISKVKKNSDGDIIEIMLEDGTVHPIEQAVAMAKENKIAGVNVGKAKNGREYLRSNPNGNENDNLDKIPTF